MIVERILAYRMGISIPRTRDPAASLPSPLALKVDGQRAVNSLWVEAAGVLYDDTCWWRWLAQLLNHTAVQIRHDDLRRAWEAEFQRQFARGCEDPWVALRCCLMFLGVSRGCCDEVQAAAIHRQKQLEGNLHPLPGARKALADLARCGISLIAVSAADCSNRRLAERLRVLALSRSFARFVSASDGGHLLADGDFYRQTLASLPHMAADTALVSNKARHLAAARQAGLATLAIGLDADVEADLHLDLFASLPCKLSYQQSASQAA